MCVKINKTETSTKIESEGQTIAEPNRKKKDFLFLPGKKSANE